MINATGTTTPHDAADAVFETGTRREDVGAALARLDESGKAAFLERLSIRAALAGMQTHDAGDAPAEDALLNRIDEVYQSEKALHAAKQRRDLSQPETWVAAEAAFGSDMGFIIKLCGRHISNPTAQFLRYVSDALGVALGQVRQHFAADGIPGVAGAEFKASGKPGTGRKEDFGDAVRAADVPDDLRARWLAE
ncbi:hypothetical protein [Methylobacterium sp. GC_Met_2]|uniref:hypothetical protein n=1 Tax=Methylobacterium sp. GC_Met_2 TaxID=2937376 RepID=UPI00226B56B5|nr:hypothetical protein [Methylobacterium sp. GC_Met_2]